MRDMSANEAVAIAGVIVFAVFILVPIVGEYPSYSWTALLYRWQTLLGGILAIAAAWLTIRQMRAGDIANELRHKENVQLALRGELNTIKRALHPQAISLKVAAFGLSTDYEYLVRMLGLDQVLSRTTTDYTAHEVMYDSRAAKSAMMMHAPNLRINATAALEALTRPQFVEAERVFDGPTCLSANEARELAQRFLRVTKSFAPDETAQPDQEITLIEIYNNDPLITLGSLISALDNLNGHLRQLEDRVQAAQLV